MADLRLFLDKVVIPTAPRPILALCHSMGAHIMLRELAENGSGPFAAGVLVSPMTGLRREAMLRSVLMLMPEVPAVEERYLFGTGPFILLARRIQLQLRDPRRAALPLHRGVVRRRPAAHPGRPDPRLGAPGRRAR